MNRKCVVQVMIVGVWGNQLNLVCVLLNVVEHFLDMMEVLKNEELKQE
jgi:hypothetical protein